MKDIRYMIHTLSAKAIMSFSKENEDVSYSFQLSQNETDKCKMNRNYMLQDVFATIPFEIRDYRTDHKDNTSWFRCSYKTLCRTPCK